MVDTLVLGTSAKAWEFESLHANVQRAVTNVTALCTTVIKTFGQAKA